MWTPALAIGWSVWLRHRGLWLMAGSVLLAMVVLYPPLFAAYRLPWVFVLSLLPLMLVVAPPLNALLFAEEEGNLGSGYPRRLYALPVPTSLLVGVPMGLGVVTAAGLGVLLAELVYRRSGFRPPTWLAAAAPPAVLAWLQTISWVPLRPAWLRLVLSVLVLPILALPLALVLLDWASPPSVVAPLLGSIALAYALARAGLERDRRGDVWHVPLDRWASALAPGRGLTTRPFRSPAAAQFWYEWRCHGWALPGAVMLFHVFFGVVMVGGGLFANADDPGFLLVIVALMPLLACLSFGAMIARFAPVWVRGTRPRAFLMVRPVSSGAIVGAKLRMAAASVGLAWAWTALLMLIALPLVRRPSPALAALRGLLANRPTAQVAALVVLAAVFLPLLTWRMLTDVMPTRLTGRRWVAESAEVLAAALMLASMAAGIATVTRPELLDRARPALPWVVSGVLAVKLVLATWAYRAALGRGLISARATGAAWAGWIALAGLLVGLLALVPRPEVAGLPAWLAPVGAAAMVPLGRFALATLALDWDRHR